MEHPLLPNIDGLSTEELNTKITELNKKLSIAYRMGNNDLCNQIRMALESYRNKYQEKLRGSNTGTDFDGMIDVN